MGSQVFFISGGSRGIGAGLVLDAVAAGHDVAFTWRTRKEDAEAVLQKARALAPERRVAAYQLDVRDGAAVERVGEVVLDEFGQVDCVVANAAVTGVGLAISTTDDEFREVIDTNLTGAFFVARQFLGQMLPRRRGRLIFVSSVAANGMSGDVAYSASKAGLIGMTKALAKEYGRKGITSNALELGLFETEMTAQDLSDDRRAFFMKHCPAGRVGQISEVAQAMLYLASDAGGFVNGQVLGLTGGLDWFP